MQVFISIGALLGPGVYSVIVTASGSYSLGYAVLGLPALLVGLQFLRNG